MGVWKQQSVVLTPKVNLTNNSQMNNLQEASWVLWFFSTLARSRDQYL